MTAEHGFQIPTKPGSWCARVQREHPDLAVEILGIFPGADGEMMETIRVSGRDAERAIDTIRFTDSVRHFEVLAQDPDACTIRVKSETCDACIAAQTARVAPAFPLVLGGGHCMWRLNATPDKARTFAATLKDSAQAPTLTRKRVFLHPPILTNRQREVLHAAVAQGYYARPRRMSLSELAAHLNIKKSSLSQTLATIEAKLLPRWAEHLAIEDDGSRANGEHGGFRE